jgi:hypothetical protein
VNAEEFRQTAETDHNVTVRSWNVHVALSTDPIRATYCHEFQIETRGEKPETEWFWIIPTPRSEVKEVYVADDRGGLAFELSEIEEKAARLEVKFRAPVGQGSKLSFQIRYEARIMSVVHSAALHESVSYSDWFSCDCFCDKLSIQVALPPKATLVKCVPPNINHERGFAFEVAARRPKEHFSLLVTYTRHRVGSLFWKWIAAQIASGAVGFGLGHI